jgi:NhaP-type Na+/H+ or K+/H+ antiporter
MDFADADRQDEACSVGAEMLEFSIICALLGSIVLLPSLFSVPIAEFTYFSKPMLAIIIGVLIGPHGAGWLNTAEWGMDSLTLIEIAAKLTIGIALMGAGIRLSHGFFAGRGFDKTAKPDARCKESIISDANNQFFRVPIFTLFGTMIPFADWRNLRSSGIMLTVGI